MSEINLDEAKINHDGEWFSAEDLTRKIQEKMQAGDAKFADLAAALEELSKAMENSHAIEVRVAISKHDYEKLTELGGADDREAVRKAVMAFIQGEGQEAPAADEDKKKTVVIKCSKCKAPIEIPADDRPTEVKCPSCGTTGRLKPKEKK
jgi:DNA-directed RNA polymerase subunit RPC12/RpoP